MNEEQKVACLITLFNSTFSEFSTRLVRGKGEPLYLPLTPDIPFHQVIFAHGYVASALHEIAHWCIAGQARRQCVDYGYWYEPDGRNAHQQAEFERVEVKPQALEWAFSLACQHNFRVSTDNLGGIEPNRLEFENRVRQQLINYLEKGFPKRALQFLLALRCHFNTAPLKSLIEEQCFAH